MKSYFCKNCGKRGHLYHQCNKSIISTGIIAFKKIDNVINYLMICRKDSLGYVDFMRGKYPLNNILYLKNIISEMTLGEKIKLLTYNFDELWNDLWHDGEEVYIKNEAETSKIKFNKLKDGITVKGKRYTLSSLVDNDPTDWESPEWGFPKGRRETGENDLECAIREWCEETGLCINRDNIVDNIFPYDEIFMGSNYKSYKHKYFLAYVPHEQCMENYQKSEVSAMKWMPYEECVAKIRPYDVEKKNVLSKIDGVFKKYILVK